MSEHDLPDALNPGDWIVDALSGTGIRGALTSDKQSLVERLNALVHANTQQPPAAGERREAPPGKAESVPRYSPQHGVGARAFVFAVDVPSGLGDEFREAFPVLSADFTATVGWYKRCLLTPAGRRHCGTIELLDIFFPRELDPASPAIARFDEDDIRRLLPPVPDTAHKGARGHLAVVAGARGSAGAALLCATAASNARVGLVSLLADSDVASAETGRIRRVSMG